MSEAHPYGKGVDGFDRTFGLPMRQFVPTLLRLARLTPGQRVLDVATGTGIAAQAALDAVGPSGHVAAVDDTPAMLDRARAWAGSPTSPLRSGGPVRCPSRPPASTRCCAAWR